VIERVIFVNNCYEILSLIHRILGKRRVNDEERLKKEENFEVGTTSILTLVTIIRNTVTIPYLA
jgi:hypothetical protein